MGERCLASVGSRMVKREPRKRVILDANRGLSSGLGESVGLGLVKPSPNDCRWGGAADDHRRYDLVADKRRHRLRCFIQQGSTSSRRTVKRSGPLCPKETRFGAYYPNIIELMDTANSA